MGKNIVIIVLAVVLALGTAFGGFMLYPRAEDAFEPAEIFKNDCEYNLKIGDTVKLEYSYDAEDARATFRTSDKSVIAVSEDGIATAVGNGVAAVNVTVLSDARNTRFVYTILMNVNEECEVCDEIYGENYFDVSYETTSYAYVGETIKLNCAYIGENGEKLTDITFKSNDEKIATVDENGYVKGITPGYTSVTATCKSNSKTFTFGVTILKKNLSAGALFVLKNHNANALVKYNLGIGDGVPGYYYDIVGSVNNAFFKPLQIDDRYYDKLGLGEKNNGLMNKVEFITVHYTGNMAFTSDADNNADYFNNLGYSASIHFVTGRSNVDYGTWSKDTYKAFSVLNEKYMGWHAGSHGLVDDTFKWLETGVPCTDASKPPVICINRDGNFTVNGYETSIKVPDRSDWADVLGPTYETQGVKQIPTFNKQGIAWDVVDGKYVIGNTYWNTQYQYTLSNVGGNNCSIGIESCVDQDSDLVHTWHVTAQLVAKLMKKYDLDIRRVQGHHFFSGKDCPQPLLENNMELWNNMFIKYVEAEYEHLTRYSSYDFNLEPVGINGTIGILDDYGLLVQDGDAHCVVYKVTVKNGSRVETIQLSTIVESNKKRPPYAEGCESIQQKGEEII